MQQTLVPCNLAGENFYCVPDNSVYSVNRDGDVFNRLLSKVVHENKTLKTIKGYSVLTFKGEKTFVHELMVKTFLYEDSSKKLIPNHKDGVKTNNRLDNLELVTFSGNLVHAFQTNLRNDNVPVLIKNLDTGEVKEFYSMAECDRCMGFQVSHVYKYLSHPCRNKILHDVYVVVVKGNEWPEIDIGTAIYLYSKLSNSLYFEHMTDKKAYVFQNVAAIDGYLKFPVSLQRVIVAKLKKSPDKTYFWNGWKISLLHSKLSIISKEAVIVNRPKVSDYRPINKPKAVTVIDDRTGEQINYLSLKDLAMSLNKSLSSVTAAVYRNKGYLNHNGRKLIVKKLSAGLVIDQ